MALDAGWDEELLALDFADLEILGFDPSLTGFGEDEIAALASMGSPGLMDPDAVPEPSEEPVSRPGDPWLLGRDGIFCGDSTDQSTVERILSNVRLHLMVTDPPCRVDASRTSGQHGSALPKIAYDARDL